MTTGADTAGGPAPRVFMSYSWDGTEHQDWVLELATRLVSNGVDVVLDRWDTQLGSDLGLFMEQAADTDYRVVAICTARYVDKADASKGGVGYEKKMITPSLMKDLHGHRVVPILRANAAGVLPKFLGATKYVDLREQPYSEASYYELLQDLHGLQATPKPPLGRNPFAALPPEDVAGTLRHDQARYTHPAFAGAVKFDYDNNDGRYVIGAGDRSFTIQFSTAGYGLIHVVSDPPDIKSMAVARGTSRPDQIGDALSYDSSSRVRTARVGDAVVLRNVNDWWAAVFIDEVYIRDTGPTGEPLVAFRYVVQPAPSPDFRNSDSDDA